MSNFWGAVQFIRFYNLIEGINNKIKVLKRNAYGYTSFTHF